jgi:hypothetical protein
VFRSPASSAKSAILHPQQKKGESQTFLISGTFGVKRCEICEATSWMRGWFFIVLRAFIILHITQNFQTDDSLKRPEKRVPDNGRLDNVFAILIDRLQDIARLGLDLGLYRLIQVHADLL